MNFLDSWIFEVALHKIINKICRLIYSVYVLTTIHMSTRPEGFWTWIKSCYILPSLANKPETRLKGTEELVDHLEEELLSVVDGSTMAQCFVGRDTLVCDAYGIKTPNQFINTLANNVRKRGAMDTLISDGGSYEVSSNQNSSRYTSAVRTSRVPSLTFNNESNCELDSHADTFVLGKYSYIFMGHEKAINIVG